MTDLACRILSYRPANAQLVSWDVAIQLSYFVDGK